MSREKRNSRDWRTQVRRRSCARLAGSSLGGLGKSTLVTNLHGRVKSCLASSEIRLADKRFDHVHADFPGK